MTFKRIVSLVLCALLMLGTFSTLAFAEDEESIVYGTDSIGLLNAMGITSWTEDELADNITRADFLKMMNLVAGYGEVKSNVRVFADLPVNDENEPFLKALYGVGIISPDGKGNIYPKGEIGIAEAAAIAVKITGYGVVAEAKGGYPAGHLAVAASNDLLDGIEVSAYKPITKGMAAVLAENALKAPIMVQVSFGETTEFEKQKDNCLLNQIHDIYYVEDIVNGVDITRIMGENDVEPLTVEVGNVEIYMPYIPNPHDAYDLLGLSVTAYYTDGDFAAPTLVHMEKSPDNIETTVDIDDIEAYDGSKLTVYSEEGKSKRYNCASSIPVVYNGVSTGKNFGLALLENKSGTVRLVDNNDDNRADVVFVNAYDVYYVSEVNGEDCIVYDRYNPRDASGNPRSIVLDNETNDPYTIIYDSKGVEIPAKKISAGDVISVFQSAEDAYQGFIVAYVTDKTVDGTITETQITENKITIDDVVYPITDTCLSRHGEILKPGQNISVKLDLGGKIIWAEKLGDASFSYGFIALASREKNGLSDNNLKIKMFTESGEFILYNTSDKVYIDSVKHDSNETGDNDPLKRLEKASIAMFGTGVFAGSTASLVKYSVNADNEIKYIDTILNSDEKAAIREDYAKNGDSVFTLTTSSSDYCRTANNTLGPRVAYTSSTRVFYYPSPAASSQDDLLNEDNYLTGVANAYLKNGVQYATTAFYSNSEKYTAEAIGMIDANKANSVLYENTRAAVIDKVFDKYDSQKDEVIKYVRMLTSSGQVDVPVERDIDIAIAGNKTGYADPTLTAKIKVTDLKKGDFVRYETYGSGYLASMQVYFRPHLEDGKYDGTYMDYGYPQQAQYRSVLAIRYGFVYDSFEEGLLMYYVNNPAQLNDPSILANITSADCDLMLRSGASPACYRYGPGEFEDFVVETASFSDLHSYKGAGEDVSRVVMHIWHGVPYAILRLEVE